MQACYHLAAAIVANKPMQIQDVTSHETTTGHAYMWAGARWPSRGRGGRVG